MNKTKVAIVTLTGDNNYGNKLQNFALQTLLEKQGYDVTTIRITNKNYLLAIVKLYLRFPLIVLKQNKLIRRRCFFKFNKNIKMTYRGISPLKYQTALRSKLDKFEFVFYGSDQIWNPEFETFSEVFLGKYSERKKNIAFSASFGIDHIPDNYKCIFTKNLDNFKAISCREQRGVELVSELSDRNAKLICDPTLCVDNEEWIKLEKKVRTPNRYVLIYFLGFQNDDIINQLNVNALPIVSADKNSPYGPSEFLYLIRHADLVITDSFHASVFSILFDRKLAIIKRSDSYTSMYSRVNSLFSILEISPDYVHDTVIFDPTNPKNINVKKHIKCLTEQAVSYVRFAIK